MWVRRFLLLIAAGISLGLSPSPRQYFRVLKSIPREWKKFDRPTLYRLSHSLKNKGLIDHIKKSNEEIEIVMTPKGQTYLSRFELDDLRFSPEQKWDGKWRLILFDIPETRKRGRDALRRKLKELGCCELQKSIFAWPYDCDKEINFIARFFNLTPHIIYVKASIQNDHRLRKFFKL